MRIKLNPQEVTISHALEFSNNLSNYYVVLENNQNEKMITIQECYPKLPTQRRPQISKISYQTFVREKPQVTEANKTMVTCYRCSGIDQAMNSSSCRSCGGLGVTSLTEYLK